MVGIFSLATTVVVCWMFSGKHRCCFIVDAYKGGCRQTFVDKLIMTEPFFWRDYRRLKEGFIKTLTCKGQPCKRKWLYVVSVKHHVLREDTYPEGVIKKFVVKLLT